MLGIAVILGSLAVWLFTGYREAKIFFLLSLATGILRFCVKFYLHRREWAKYPGPPHSFFWGHLKIFGEAMMATGTQGFELTLNTFVDYAPDKVLYLDMWPIQAPLVVVWDEVADEQILVTDNIPKSQPAYMALKTVIGKSSLVAIGGEFWKKLRKVFNPAFAPSHLDSQVPAILEESMIFIDRLKEVAASGKTVPMAQLTMYLTVDIIASISLNTQKASMQMIDSLTDLIVDASVVTPVDIVLRNISPVAAFKRWYNEKYLPIALPANTRIVNDKMRQYIRTKTSRSADSKSTDGKDLLDMVLEDPQSPNLLTDSILIDQMKTFFFAGHDTTASTISWAYYFLYHHPEELSRLRTELDTVFGPNTSPSDIANQITADPKLHTKLDFTLAVIKESLRMEPPAAPARQPPENTHYTFKTTSGTTHYVPPKSMVYTSAWMLHRNKDVWGADADEFKPDRFMPGRKQPWGYLAFSKRPRDCIGSTLAYLEAKIILALTARMFDFEPTITYHRVLKGTQKPCFDAPMKVKLSNYQG